jgi:hypothetical protein
MQQERQHCPVLLPITVITNQSAHLHDQCKSQCHLAIIKCPSQGVDDQRCCLVQNTVTLISHATESQTLYIDFACNWLEMSVSTCLSSKPQSPGCHLGPMPTICCLLYKPNHTDTPTSHAATPESKKHCTMLDACKVQSPGYHQEPMPGS